MKALDEERKMMSAPPKKLKLGGPTSFETEAATQSVTFPPNCKKELGVLELIKFVLPRASYIQFLRCLNLYSKDIITKSELVYLVEDLFMSNGSAKYGDAFQRFKEQVLDYNEWEDNQQAVNEKANYYVFVSAMNSLPLPQRTPSYRELPPEVPRPPCSGRFKLCFDVLNDDLMSVPSGTEDQTYQTARKNEYEEALFRCEDERFELDRLIEGNKSALRALSECLRDLELGAEPARVLDNRLKTLHLYAIARLYGDQWYEALTLLKENPFRAVPVIMKRMKQKHTEWDGVRSQLRLSWRKVVESNFHRSLDHRSFYFKQEDKKRLTPRIIVAELKEAHASKMQDVSLPVLDRDMISEVSQEIDTSCLSSSFSRIDIHRKIADLVSIASEVYLDADANGIKSLISDFVFHFLGVPKSDTMGESDASNPRVEPFGNTKPVRVQMESWAFQEKIAPIRRHSRPSHLFFCNYTFYVFFKLYQLLYERICSMEELTKNKEGSYDFILGLITNLLEGKLDHSHFEDELRALLGTQSYCMFTIDKVLNGLLKQVCLMILVF